MAHRMVGKLKKQVEHFKSGFDSHIANLDTKGTTASFVIRKVCAKYRSWCSSCRPQSHASTAITRIPARSGSHDS